MSAALHARRSADLQDNKPAVAASAYKMGGFLPAAVSSLGCDWEFFRALVEKGRELVALHLMESPKLDECITSYPVEGEHLVEKVRYEEKPVAKGQSGPSARKAGLGVNSVAKERVWINKTQYFEGVPREVWEFHIGGYQVCEKWLKDRRGRRLTDDDLKHYQKIVVALAETIRLMKEIDQIIPGWPLP